MAQSTNVLPCNTNPIHTGGKCGGATDTWLQFNEQLQYAYEFTLTFLCWGRRNRIHNLQSNLPEDLGRLRAPAPQMSFVSIYKETLRALEMALHRPQQEAAFLVFISKELRPHSYGSFMPCQALTSSCNFHRLHRLWLCRLKEAEILYRWTTPSFTLFLPLSPSWSPPQRPRVGLGPVPSGDTRTPKPTGCWAWI